MAPEVKACKNKKEYYSPQLADIYSLGICLFGILYDVPCNILENAHHIRTRMLQMEMVDMDNYTYFELNMFSEESLMINTCIVDAKTRYKTDQLLQTRFFADKKISLTRDIATEIS